VYCFDWVNNELLTGAADSNRCYQLKAFDVVEPGQVGDEVGVLIWNGT
jgi:hypothetical protein